MRKTQSSVGLFEPDLFSTVRQPLFEDPALVASLEEMLSVLEKSYGISRSQIDDLRSVPNCINSDLLRFQAGPRRLFFKRRKLPSESMEGLLRSVGALGEEFLPVVVPTRQGKCSVMEKELIFYLMQEVGAGGTYAEGREPGLAEDVGCAVRSLSRLRPSSTLPLRSFFTPEEERVYKRLDSLAADNELHAAVRPFWEPFRENYSETRAACKKAGWDGPPDEICHIDLHPHNLLVKNSRLVCILDLESIQAARRVACLGFFIFKAVRNCRVLFGPSSDMAELRKRLVSGLIKSGALKMPEVPLLVLGARLENIKRFLTGFIKTDPLKGGERLPYFGKALAGEIDAVFQEK